MSVLVYINSANGLHKSAFEAVTYGKKLGSDVTVITTGNTDSGTLASLGKYGASKVLVDRSFKGEDDQQLTRVIASAAEQTAASTVVFSHDLIAKAVGASGSTKPEGIIAYWNSIKGLPGHFGTYNYSLDQHNGYSTSEIVMSEARSAKNGTFALAPGY